MAHNVSGIRRFASPNNGYAKQSPGLAKCGGEKLHKGASAGCSFSEPGAAKGGGTYTVCYALVLLFLFSSFCLMIFECFIKYLFNILEQIPGKISILSYQDYFV